MARGALPAPEDTATPPVANIAASTGRFLVGIDELTAMAHTLHRAGRSSAQLAQLLGGAAQCCREEEEVIEEAKQALQQRIDAAGFRYDPPS